MEEIPDYEHDRTAREVAEKRVNSAGIFATMQAAVLRGIARRVQRRRQRIEKESKQRRKQRVAEREKRRLKMQEKRARRNS